MAGHTISAMPRWHAYVLGLGRHPAIVAYEPGYARVARERATLAAPAPPTPSPWWEHRSDAGPDTAQVVQLPTTRGPGR